MNSENDNQEYETKRIEHYSLTELIYTVSCGGAGMLAIEKFIEGEYTIGIISATLSIAFGFGTYVAVKNINDDAKELGARVNFYRNLAMKIHPPSKKVAEQSLENVCEIKEAKVLPFRRTLKHVTNDDDPDNSVA